jgi:hypothetical protein
MASKSFDIVDHTMAADVADNGTFTIAYPSGRSAGNYAGAAGHKMFALQTYRSSPNDFSLSFGASNITVTYLGSTTLPAGAAVKFQLDRVAGDKTPDKAITNLQMIPAGLQLLDLGSPGTADSDGVCASQSVAAGAAFLINGLLASNGAVVFDTPRNVVAGWTTESVLTITGKDVDGNTVVEKSASGTSHTGKKAFKSVSSVASSASITGATVGTGVVIGLPARVASASNILAELKNGVALPRRPGVVYLSYNITEALLDTGTSRFVVSPVAGAIRKITTVAEDTITTGGTITAKIATVAVDGGVVTIANGAAAGEVDSAVCTLGHASTVVAVGTAIELALDSAFNASAPLHVIIEIDTTAAGQLTGTFVAAVDSAATGTTGDVRGTYSPLTAPDGATAYALLVAMPAPDDRGVAQYTG